MENRPPKNSRDIMLIRDYRVCMFIVINDIDINKSIVSFIRAPLVLSRGATTDAFLDAWIGNVQFEST